jgi:hypothetical protein
VLNPSVREFHQQNNFLPPPPQQQRGETFQAHNGQRMRFQNNAQAHAMMMPGKSDSPRPLERDVDQPCLFSRARQSQHIYVLEKGGVFFLVKRSVMLDVDKI